MNKGFFITIEGPDGAGKSTHIRRLVSLIESLGYEVVLSREPGGTELGESIRSMLLDPAFKGMDPMAELLLYAASRAQHVSSVIRPALEEGKAVICDRFTDSSLAYQGVARGLGEESVRAINRFATGGVMPELTLCIMIDPSIAYQRILSRGEALDRLEQESFEFHRMVYQGYADIAKAESERVVMIDASGEIEETAAIIRREVLSRLSAKSEAENIN